MKKIGTLAILAGLAVILLVGVYEVFRLRFQAGDVYPEYSTLRADPLGAKAAFDTLEAMGEFALVSRYQQDLRLLKSGADSTLFFAGATGNWFDYELSKAEFEALDAAIVRGTRVVITLSGRDNTFGDDISVEERGEAEAMTPDEVLDREATQVPEKIADEEADASDADADASDPAEWRVGFDAVKEKWGFAVGFATEEDWDVEEGIEADISDDSEFFGEALSIRSPWRFTRLDNAWNANATVEGRPVMMERSYGEGVIVLCADSWFLSNEALAKHRRLGELLWAVGSRPVLIFDETHHGVQESEGVVGMAARYRLHGVLPGLVILFLLVLWRGSSSLVPGDAFMVPGVGDAVTVDGIDSESGVVRLMRNGISGQEILRQCYLAWSRNPVLRRRFSKGQVEAVRDRIVAEEEKSSGQRSFVNAYRDIVQLLSRRSSS